MHCLGVPNFRKMFCYEGIQYSLLDPKWYVEVFQSISQTFDMKNLAKLVFWWGMHYLGVPNFRKMFYMEHIQSNLLHPKWLLEMFKSIVQTFETKNLAKLVFWWGMHYLGYRTFRKCFATNTSNQTCYIQNDGWKCLAALCKPSTQKTLQNLCFGAECTVSGYRTFGKYFATNTSNQTCYIQNDGWKCLRQLCKPSTQKSYKTCVSGRNALSRGNELPENVFLWRHPI